MIHETLRNGSMAELYAAAELIKRDWYTAFPFITACEFDLIIFREKEFRTIQVKSTATKTCGNFPRVVKDFDKYSGCDYIICYDVINRRWFIFTAEELANRQSVTLSPLKYPRNCDNWDLIR